LIAIFFRRLSGAILVSLSLAMALCWTFGVTYLVIGELNTITGFMVVILFGLGIDYGIHTFARYAEARSAGSNVQQAIDQMVCQTGTAVATTAITTAATSASSRAWGCSSPSWQW
jgi:predicted RND superfamily exporter protein